MMRYLFIIGFLALAPRLFSQENGKWLRAFPITAYMVDLDDSTRVVQLEMPEGKRLPDRELALAMAIYRDGDGEPSMLGYGRCHLVKGPYHYFAIHYEAGRNLREGDLLYMYLDSTDIYYGLIPRLAGHFIRLQDVHEQPFYDRYLVFDRWTRADEDRLLDTLLGDIRFTGNYMRENEPGTNMRIQQGRFAGKQVFDLMTDCTQQELRDMLSFMIDNPRRYAGATWKISEIFATWALNAL